jgi:hypothetical protein
MSSVPAANLSQIDVAQLKAYADRVSATPELADREPRGIARWAGQSRSKVAFGDTSMHLGGDGELNPMQAVLGSLAACDVDLVAMHASLLGMEITELWVEARGRFHIARYLGLDSQQPPATSTSTTRCTFGSGRHPRSRSRGSGICARPAQRSVTR